MKILSYKNVQTELKKNRTYNLKTEGDLEKSLKSKFLA